MKNTNRRRRRMKGDLMSVPPYFFNKTCREGRKYIDNLWAREGANNNSGMKKQSSSKSRGERHNFVVKVSPHSVLTDLSRRFAAFRQLFTTAAPCRSFRRHRSLDTFPSCRYFLVRSRPSPQKSRLLFSRFILFYSVLHYLKNTYSLCFFDSKWKNWIVVRHSTHTLLTYKIVNFWAEGLQLHFQSKLTFFFLNSSNFLIMSIKQ